MEGTNDTYELFSDHRILASNSFFSFLSIYGNFFFNLIITILIARLISKDAWTILIIANSYILIFTTILTFFPPGLQQTLHYYLPRYNSLRQYENLKGLIKSSSVIVMIFLIPIFLISLLIITFFPNLFLVNLNPDGIQLLYLFSPLIIINGIDLFLTSINQGLNRYKIIFLLLVLKNLLYIGLLLAYFIIVGNLELYVIAIINVISYAISFFINLFYVLRNFLKIKTTSKLQIFRNTDLKNILKYGSPVRAGRFLTDIWGEIQIQSIGTFFPLYTTGLYLARTYLSVSTNALNSFSAPLTVSFSSFIAKDEKNRIRSMYNLIIKYSSFIFLILTGVLYLTTDFFLYILGTDYLIFSNILKLYLFSYLFLGFAAPFDSLMLAENKSKYVLYVRILGTILRIPIFFILLIFVGLIPALIGIIISNSILGFFYAYFTIRLGKITIDAKPLVILYLTFAISITAVIIMQIFFLYDIEALFLSFLNLGILHYFYPLSIIIFLGLFVSLTIILKIVTAEDIENLRTVFQKQKFFNKILSRILLILNRNQK